MKQYPPRPWFIYPADWSQLWIVIPLCLFLCLCRGGGILAAITLFLFWMLYKAQSAEEGWRHACDTNMELHYTTQEYINSTGYIKIKGNYYYITEEIKKKILEEEKQKEDNKNDKELEQDVVWTTRDGSINGFPCVIYHGQKMEIREYYKILEEKERNNEEK